MEAVERVAGAYQSRIQTSKLNQALRRLFQAHAPALQQGRQVKFFYATQTGFGPPTFTLFVNSPKGLTPDYQRYLVHQLRAALGLESSPIRLTLRPRRDERKKGSRVKRVKGQRDDHEPRARTRRGRGIKQ